MINYGITLSISIFLVLNFVLTERSMADWFKLYKYKYNRVYGNDDIEQIAFLNFVNNKNKMRNAEHIANTTGTPTIYRLNIYADQDIEEASEHYGINITPCEYFIS